MMTTSSKHLSKILIVILGVMTAFGPLTIDMYGPSLPKVQHAFGSSISEIQLTLSFAMIGLAIGQFVFGPLSDVLGRKNGTHFIDWIFNSLIIISFTVHLTIFLIIRLIQGLAGGGAIVIAKASIGDNYDGDELAKFLTSLMVINGIITIIAPLLGGLALSIASWRMIFIFLTIITLIVILGILLKMPVGLHQEQSQLNFKAIFKDFGLLLTKPTFVIPMLLQGLTYVMLFSYSSAAPFISQKMYHMTPLQYSAMFAINGVGLIVVSQITAIIVEKVSRYAMLIYLTIIQMSGVVILIFTLTLHLPLYVLLIGFLLIYVQSLL